MDKMSDPRQNNPYSPAPPQQMPYNTNNVHQKIVNVDNFLRFFKGKRIKGIIFIKQNKQRQDKLTHII